MEKVHSSDKIHSIEITTKYYEDFDPIIYKKIKTKYLKLQSLIFYGAPVDKLLHATYVNNNAMMMVVLSKDIIRSEKDCGKISQDYFVTNRLNFILENINYNNCLNKKISVDKYCYIRNCPSMLEDFGNIDSTSLKSVIGNIRFTKFWNLKKDDISVCKDCEFKYVCSDCRAYTVDNELLGKPEKCEYSP